VVCRWTGRAIFMLMVAVALVALATACGSFLSIDDDEGEPPRPASPSDGGDELPFGSGGGEAGDPRDEASVRLPDIPDAGACGTNLKDDFDTNSTPSWNPKPPWTTSASEDAGVEISADGHRPSLIGLHMQAFTYQATAVFETPIAHGGASACTLRVQQWIKFGPTGDSKAGFVIFEAKLAGGRTLGVRVDPNNTTPTQTHYFEMYELPSNIRMRAPQTWKRDEWIDFRVSFEANTGIYRLTFNGALGGQLQLAAGLPERARFGLLGALASGFQEKEETFLDDVSVQY
jgi:hypothetical protein